MGECKVEAFIHQGLDFMSPIGRRFSCYILTLLISCNQKLHFTFFKSKLPLTLLKKLKLWGIILSMGKIQVFSKMELALFF